MARRYVFTPARRAALKRAQAKSAAKRRKSRVNRKGYRAAKKQANKTYANQHSQAGFSRKKQKEATLNFDRNINKARVKYKGKKKLSDKQLKRRRTAKNAAAQGVGVAIYMGANYSLYRMGQSEYEKTARKTQKTAKKSAKTARKTAKKQYKQDKAMSLKVRKQNLAKAGLNPDGSMRRNTRRRKPVKVRSQRVAQRAIAGRRA